MRRSMALGAWVALVACHQAAPIRIAVADGSTTRALTFLVSTPDSAATIRGLRIRANDVVDSELQGNEGRLVWSLIPGARSPVTVPASITYGIAPAGFSASTAVGLVPGDYSVEVLRDGPSNMSHFTVNNRGQVSQ